MRSHLLLFVLLLCSFRSSAQTGIQLNTSEALESYTLIENNIGTYLIDNCGEVVNYWDTPTTDLHPKLLPNGDLLYITFGAIEVVDWNGLYVKGLYHGDPDLELVYEVIPLENGNYLSLGRRDFSIEQFEAIGYNYGSGNPSSPTVVDVVVELDGQTGDIVWEWNISDHVIQERDANAPNYGSISSSPELLDLDAIEIFDWTFYESFMINGMDYNPDLDQIALSVRKISEVIIIDHSTTTEEAAGHTGGNSGKGGDILYRWGNPRNYDRGSSIDRQLFFQHNPNWITEGEHAGKLIIYDNGLTRPGVSFEDRYSTAPIIAPPMDELGNYIIEEGEAFGPAEPDFLLSGSETDSPFYSSYTSGAEVLPNGNIYITEGIDGRLMEFNTEGELVWQYTVPGVSFIFRTEKYAVDYPAFVDRELVPSGTISGIPSQYDCQLLTSTEAIVTNEQVFKASHLAGTHQILLENLKGSGLQYNLYNVQGQLLQSGQTASSQHTLDSSQLSDGLYVVQLATLRNLNLSTFKIMIND